MYCTSPRLSIAALLILLASTGARADLLIVELAPLHGGASTGMRPGDRILGWQTELSSGSLDDPLSFQLLEIEWMPLGPVTLIGEREGEPRRWELPATRWGIKTEPEVGEPANARQRAWSRLGEARQLLHDGDTEAANDVIALAARELASPIGSAILNLEWAAALTEIDDRAATLSSLEQALGDFRASDEQRPLLEAELLERVGVAAKQVMDLDVAEQYLNEALTLRRELAPGGYSEAELLYELHLCAFYRGDLHRASELGEGALAIYEILPASEYVLARARSDVGRVSLNLGDHATARIRFESARAVFLQADPESADVGEATTNLGILARRSGDLEVATERFTAALAIYEAIDPEGRAAAMLMNNLGAVAFDRGDLFAAEHFVGRALELRQERDPNSMAVAMYLDNVASMALERGDLAKAERLYLQVLAIREELAPESLGTALSNENLGAVCFERGDLDRSSAYFERSLVTVREVAPGSADEARILRNMGQLASTGGDPATALGLIEQSLAIRIQLSPGSVDHASSLSGLADANRQLGNYDTARRQLEAAMAIIEEFAPDGLTMAAYCGMLSTLELETGDAEAALRYATRSLELRQALIDGSYWEAVSWRSIGRAHRAAGNKKLALDAFVAATDLMDQQGSSVGSIESSRVSFRARHADMYRDCIDARISQGDLAGAIEDLERSRARSFLTMLGQRDLQFSADLPTDLLARRRRNRTEYDRTLSELARVSPSDESVTADSLSRELAELADERGHIAAEVKHLAPDLDALERPQLLSADEILERIPEGTVLISYSVGPERSHGLVILGAGSGSRAETSRFTVEIDRSSLEEKVRGFRKAIQSRAPFEDDAVTLYRLLLEPAADAIAAGRRLLLSPDGPLHLLPFAALLVPEKEGPPRFLTQWRPLHFTSSVAVYAEQKGQRQAGAGDEIVVFADPTVKAADGSPAAQPMQIAMNSSSYRGLVGGARDLGRLEFAREEAAAIESLYGSSRTTVYLGGYASETRAKGLSGDFSYIHFACHGVADQTDPLNSALILSEISTGDSRTENGILQSWEVLESVRFDAELVTLSACETALGADMGGEGIVSLVRSFQYAGARSVLASLWQVADRPTAILMENFYGALKEGQPKDEALRTAQLMSLDPDGAPVTSSSSRGVGGLAGVENAATHPFYWAAFQIYGDPSPAK
jgi:CHAT domain-containing protein